MVLPSWTPGKVSKKPRIPLKTTIHCEVKVKLLSHVWLFATPWTVVHQVPPSMGFSRQEYRRGLPFPSPGNLPDPGIKPRSPALQADALTSEPPGKPMLIEHPIFSLSAYLPHYILIPPLLVWAMWIRDSQPGLSIRITYRAFYCWTPPSKLLT